ncbi:MAG TPA: ribosome-associated translation inhibitor RaiA [Thermoanaerobaculia bacterium]|nr:ribosome-associated translation inhibitor RaiA [Thermoanaerobaculia bacterium]
MTIEISGRNYEVTDRVRKMITKKLEKLEKYFADIIEIRCVLNTEKFRNICEIIIIGKDYDLKSIQEADDMDAAIASTMDHLKRQATKSRQKIKDHHKKDKSLLTGNWTEQVLQPGNLRTAEAGPRIIKTKKLVIRPMSIEQAALMLDGSKNQFVVFRDLDTDKVTVIYKRSDQNFGMIAPEL